MKNFLQKNSEKFTTLFLVTYTLFILTVVTMSIV